MFRNVLSFVHISCACCVCFLCVCVSVSVCACCVVCLSVCTVCSLCVYMCVICLSFCLCVCVCVFLFEIHHVHIRDRRVSRPDGITTSHSLVFVLQKRNRPVPKPPSQRNRLRRSRSIGSLSEMSALLQRDQAVASGPPGRPLAGDLAQVNSISSGSAPSGSGHTTCGTPSDVSARGLHTGRSEVKTQLSRKQISIRSRANRRMHHRSRSVGSLKGVRAFFCYCDVAFLFVCLFAWFFLFRVLLWCTLPIAAPLFVRILFTHTHTRSLFLVHAHTHTLSLSLFLLFFHPLTVALGRGPSVPRRTERAGTSRWRIPEQATS
jgi:hypothetical protein